MSCKIYLDHPGVYHPGDRVSGSVICTFEERENIRSIKYRFKGKEHTHWSEKHGKHSTHYKGEKIFATTELIIREEGPVQPGRYEYMFSFNLPPSNIPSSYHHQLGEIRYYVTAIVDRPFAIDYRDEVTLHVISKIDVNEICQPAQLGPSAYQQEQQVGSCFCKNGLVDINMTLYKNFFKLGEIIDLRVDINNRSSLTISDVQANLFSNISFKANQPRDREKFDKALLAISDNGDRVDPFSTKSFNFAITIPENAVIPNFLGCEFFYHWVAIEVEAFLPFCYSNIRLEARIKIASYSYSTSRTALSNAPVAVLNSEFASLPGNGPPYPVGEPGHPIQPTAPFGDRNPTAPSKDPMPPTYDDVMNSKN